MGSCREWRTERRTYRDVDTHHEAEVLGEGSYKVHQGGARAGGPAENQTLGPEQRRGRRDMNKQRQRRGRRDMNKQRQRRQERHEQAEAEEAGETKSEER